MSIWLYTLAAICGLGSALILATVVVMLIPLGLWPVLAGVSVYFAGVGIASAFWTVHYDRLSRELMRWHFAQLEDLKGKVPDMLKEMFRKMQADGILPEGIDMEVRDASEPAPDKPSPDKKLN